MTNRKICPSCGREKFICERNDCLPDEVKAELTRWIKQHGVRWRAALREHWLRDGDELRYLRNAIGPSGIAKIRPTGIQLGEIRTVNESEFA